MFFDLLRNLRILFFLCGHFIIDIGPILSKDSHASIICGDVFDVRYFRWELIQRILRWSSMDPIGAFFEPKDWTVIQSHWCWFGSSSHVITGFKKQNFLAILGQIVGSWRAGNPSTNHNNIVLGWSGVVFRGILRSENKKKWDFEESVF